VTLGRTAPGILRAYRTFNAQAEAFCKASEAQESEVL
jgi:hypothetical protein